MDAHPGAELPRNTAEVDVAQRADDVSAAHIEAASAPYLGRWNRLVSTTNWEKGRIICQWRQALIDSGAPAAAYADEAWSRRVGNVSGQHVGRLRRVFERFGQAAQDYPGLYWSHFQAALDWHDAEMWLEGAVQNGWSVAQMRQTRWQTIGSPPDQTPREQDIVASEMDEDADPVDESPAGVIGEALDVVQPVEPAGPADESPWEETAACGPGETDAPAVRPFENLPALPEDLAEAFEAMKLAIVHHRLCGWQEISCRDVLAALDALKQLALAPGDE